MVKDGIHFPKNLQTTAAVNYVLTQKPGQMKAKDLRAVIQDTGAGEGGDNITALANDGNNKNNTRNKQMKEAVFQHLVGKNIAEEEKNQLRWYVLRLRCKYVKLEVFKEIKMKIYSTINCKEELNAI